MIRPKAWAIGTGCVIFFMAVFGLLTQTKLVSGLFQDKVAHVELQDVVTAHPDWGKYQKLEDELKLLQLNWAEQSGGKVDITGNSDPGQSALNYQMAEIERIYNEEIQLKVVNLNKTLSEYQKKRQTQASMAFKEKVDSLNTAFNKEIEAKSEEMTGKLNRFRSQIQAEHQLELSNLQLQLSMLDMSLSPNGNNQEEKGKIQTQINQINLEIESKIAEEQKKLQQELNRFAKERKDAVSVEAENYQTQLRTQLEDDFKQYRAKMETEFNRWQQQRKIELESTIKSRKAQTSVEYKRYSSQKLVLESQMKQIKEAILWEIKKKAKLLAREKRVDLIVTGDLAKFKKYDLTLELKKMVR